MVTRFYFDRTTAGDVSPAFDAGWEDTDEAVNRKLVATTRPNEGIIDGTQHDWTPGQDSLDRQYVSSPMDAGISFSGVTVKCQGMTREHNAGDNSTSRMGIRIVNQAGDTVQQTLLAVAQYGPATEYINNASFRNKTFADGDTVSGTYTTSAGDRLVVEIGHSDATGSTPQATAKWGSSDSSGDLPENETSTTLASPWIEFSNNITFQAPATTSPGWQGGGWF